MSSALAARSLTAYASTPGASSPSFWLDTKNLGKGSPSVTQPHRAQPKPRRSLQKSHTQVTFITDSADECDIHPARSALGAGARVHHATSAPRHVRAVRGVRATPRSCRPRRPRCSPRPTLPARQQRLTLFLSSIYVDGMSHGMGLAEAASGADPASGLQAARELRELAERLEALQVSNARKHGWSWQEIAFFLGVSKQAVHKKHAGRRADSQRSREE